MKTGANYVGRIYLIAALAIAFCVMLIARLFFVQIASGDEYAKIADRQYAKPDSGYFARGNIFFAEKNGHLISAATLKTVYVIAINPSVISNAEGVYLKLSQLVALDHDSFLIKAAKKDDPYEVVIKTDDATVADKIREAKISGVGVYKENIRFYPGGRLASHILGLVGLLKEEGNKVAGRYGIEREFDGVLRRDQSSLSTNFFAELFSNVRGVADGDPTDMGGDVVLTIEPNVQMELEKELTDTRGKWDGDSVGGIIMEPTTGRILGMAAMPDFSPALFAGENNMGVFVNPLVENVFELGSVVKSLTMAAALDKGVVTPDTKYTDTGSVTLNGKTIYNHDFKKMGKVDMQAVLDNSLNTGAVFAMQKLGRSDFRRYMKSFGLGEKTGIDLPGEVAGLAKNLDSKYDIDYATVAFGQGVAQTPIAAVRAFSSLANGGLLLRPIIVDRIEEKVGITKKFVPEISRRVIKKETSEEITRMLVHAFDHGLAGGKYKMERYTVAAKTGTAQMPDGKGAYGDKYLHSFFGYFPAYNPRFLVLLYMVNPKNGAQFSSDTLPEPFVNIARYLLNYYEVPPDR